MPRVSRRPGVIQGGARSAVALALAFACVPNLAHASPWTVATAPTAAGAPPAAAASPAGTASPPAAEGARSEAEREWEAASNAYALGNYAEAVGHFERSYELSQEPAMLFNIGQAYGRWYELSDDLAHLRKARKLFENYRMYLEQAEGDHAAALAEAKAKIAELDQRIEEHEDRHRGSAGADKPVYKRGWFWGTLVGVLVVAAGVTTAVLLTRPREEDIDPELGTLGDRRLEGFGIRF